MENGKDSLKTYITGLKNSCSSGGPTEKLSNSSADRKIVEVRSQRYSKLYELHRKIIKTKLTKEWILISMHIPSLYANALQAEDIVCTAYENFHINDIPVSKHSNSTNKITCKRTEPP